MLKFSEIFWNVLISRENSYFERIRMVRMVRMVRSLADRTFQLWGVPRAVVLRAQLREHVGAVAVGRRREGLPGRSVAPKDTSEYFWIILNNLNLFSQNSEFSANFWFVFANLIEQATHVTIFWNLARNPEKNSSKIRRKNTKFEVFAIELMNIH